MLVSSKYNDTKNGNEKRPAFLCAHHRLGTWWRVSRALSDVWEKHILTDFMTREQQMS